MKISFSKNLSNQKFIFSFLPILLVGAVFLLWPEIARAGFVNVVTKIVASVISGLVDVLGKILIQVINGVIWVAQYNDFINSPAVTHGWSILRDVCNMFFILILLVIAFATTLNRESYGMKKLLPKFIIAAVLINFSKLICGIIIDFAQVIMLTFVNGFRDVGGGNFANMLGLTDMLSKSQTSCGDDLSLMTLLGTYLLALIYVIIATVVMVIILMVLVMRMITIWIYVVLSPMAWLLSVLPATQNLASKWWKQFSEAVASGPVLAFFIWLSFVTVTTTTTAQTLLKTDKPTVPPKESEYLTKTQESCVGFSNAGSLDGMLKFVISIGLLMGGLIISKEIGGAAGGIAGAGLAKIQSAARKTRDFAIKNTAGRAVSAGKSAGKSLAVNTGKFTARTGVGVAGWGTGLAGKGLSKVSGGRMGESLQKGGQFMKDWRQDMRETREKAKVTKRRNTLEKLGMREKGMSSYEEFLKTPLAKGAKGVALAGAGVLTGNPLLMASGVAAGAGLTAYSLGSKKIAGSIKNWAANRQKNRNLEKLEKISNGADKRMTKEKQAGLDSLASTYGQKIRNYNKSEKSELDAEKIKNEQELSVAKARGDKPEDIKKLQEKHQQSLQAISEKYGDSKAIAKNQYEESAKALDTRLRSKYSGRLSNKQQYYEAAKEVIDRDQKIKDTKKNKEADLKKNSELMDNEIKSVKQNFSGSGLARDMEINKVKKKYADFEKSINASYIKKMDDINARYQNVPAEASQLRSWDTKKLDASGNYIEKYTPNKLSIKAAQAGSKELANAKNMVYQLGITGTDQFKGSDFSTGKGITTEQMKMFRELSGAGEEAKKAINNMVSGLKQMKLNINTLTPATRKMVEDMKKGLAYFKTEKPDEAAALQAIVSELNDFNTGHDKGWIRVEDFGPKNKK